MYITGEKVWKNIKFGEFYIIFLHCDSRSFGRPDACASICREALTFQGKLPIKMYIMNNKWKCECQDFTYENIACK